MSLIPIQDRNWPEEVGSVTGGEERRGASLRFEPSQDQFVYRLQTWLLLHSAHTSHLTPHNLHLTNTIRIYEDQRKLLNFCNFFYLKNSNLQVIKYKIKVRMNKDPNKIDLCHLNENLLFNPRN